MPPHRGEWPAPFAADHHHRAPVATTGAHRFPPDKDAAMRLWVDADACPNVIKDIVFRAADRVGIETVLVANQLVRTPPSPHIRSLQVPGGLDAADEAIIERVEAGDLVVTADIPLADKVIAKGALALNPRGELYTADSIAQRLSLRNFMDELRGAGINTGGPAALHARDRQAFANQLDRLLRQCCVPRSTKTKE
jgi:uncharacterized protein YaiI (UPF0178 family)